MLMPSVWQNNRSSYCGRCCELVYTLIKYIWCTFLYLIYTKFLGKHTAYYSIWCTLLPSLLLHSYYTPQWLMHHVVSFLLPFHVVFYRIISQSASTSAPYELLVMCTLFFYCSFMHINSLLRMHGFTKPSVCAPCSFLPYVCIFTKSFGRQPNVAVPPEIVCVCVYGGQSSNKTIKIRMRNTLGEIVRTFRGDVWVGEKLNVFMMCKCTQRQNNHWAKEKRYNQ